jgi:hypothetical protein
VPMEEPHPGAGAGARPVTNVITFLRS